MQKYYDTLSHHQRCLDQAQRDVYQSVMETLGSVWCLQEQDLPSHLDDTLRASLALWQAHADGQRDLQRLSERWLSAIHAAWLSPWAGREHPISQVIHISDVSCCAMATISRQVSHFAVTRLSAAALTAAREARQAWLNGPGDGTIRTDTRRLSHLRSVKIA